MAINPYLMLDSSSLTPEHLILPFLPFSINPGCYRAAQIGVADKRTDAGTLVLLDLLDALEQVRRSFPLSSSYLPPPPISDISRFVGLSISHH